MKFDEGEKMDKKQIKKMIQNRVKFLIKESQPLSVKPEEYTIYRKRIEELDWVLSLFS